jgi:hypothetical protein
MSFGISTTNGTAVSLSSREGANPPQLVITTSNTAGVAPLLPSRPDPLPPVVFLFVPLLAPTLLMLSGPGRRALNGALAGSVEPGLIAAARASMRTRIAARHAADA